MKISLGTMKEKGQELATFLEPRVGTAPSVSGDSIEIDDGSLRAGVKPRDVKTYIKRFMYMNGIRKNYRVFVAGKELTVQEIELEEKEEAKPEAPEAPAPEEAKEEAPEGEKKEEAQKPKKGAAKKPRAKKKKEESEA
ncbi:MAG: hypothetical protein OK438_08055 [Thaumarchaeota archaeon]|nr:hypothetical protein [Nitrososphaerota archaeon]